MKITILGCGTSSGVPMIGCGLRVCAARADPRNTAGAGSRVLVESGDARLLIDTPPDLHAQLVDAEVAQPGCGALHPRPRRSCAWHRRPALHQLPYRAGARHLWLGRDAGGDPGALRLCISAHGHKGLGEAEPESGGDRGAVRGGRRCGDAVPAGARARHHHRLPDRRHGVFHRREGPSRRRPSQRWKA